MSLSLATSPVNSFGAMERKKIPSMNQRNGAATEIVKLEMGATAVGVMIRLGAGAGAAGVVVANDAKVGERERGRANIGRGALGRGKEARGKITGLKGAASAGELAKN